MELVRLGTSKELHVQNPRNTGFSDVDETLCGRPMVDIATLWKPADIMDFWFGECCIECADRIKGRMVEVCGDLGSDGMKMGLGK